ncbi:MAG TPA: Fe-Mn family superoxide dismutase [Candidatus Binatia bacterium]|nr:Fe-Mn family superoxide dismutase [Candidatus Binatia bacterium]
MIAPYPVKVFELTGLHGLSTLQIETHLELYAGYVNNTNRLNEQLAELAAGGKAGTPAYSELTRRLGFEYNGMRLHELYFENLTPRFEPPGRDSPLYRELDRTFGRFERWQRDFTAVASMRGVGWALLYQDPETGRLSNHWISLHEHGHPAGFRPLLVMDVWEHAFLVDYKPTERAKYIDAFFANVNWRVVAARFAGDARDARQAAQA